MRPRAVDAHVGDLPSGRKVPWNPLAMPTAIDLKKHTFTSRKFESVIQEAMRFMMASPIHPLPPADRFPGAGVYALYYCGGFEYYRHIAVAYQKDGKTPIYVGKAVPPGWRVGRAGRVGPNVRPLHRRLAEHAGNINEVNNLEASDFSCRFMILGGTESDLISACEAKLIRQFTPLWNTVVDGFGSDNCSRHQPTTDYRTSNLRNCKNTHTQHRSSQRALSERLTHQSAAPVNGHRHQPILIPNELREFRVLELCVAIGA